MWQFKQRQIAAEYSREFCKRMAYRNEYIDPVLDQAILFGRQVEEEMEALRTPCVVVTDSPILLQAVYGQAYGFVAGEVNRKLDNLYPSIHIFLDRQDREYSAVGRYQTHDQAKEIDMKLRLVHPNMHIVRYDDYDAILNLIGLTTANDNSSSNQ